MADTKTKAEKLGAVQLRARAKWSTTRLGPLPEPIKMGRLAFAARLSQTDGGRRKTVGAVAADTVAIFAAAQCQRTVELAELLKPYGGIVTKGSILFCIGPVGFLCALDLDAEEMDIAGLKLAAQLAHQGRGCLSSEIAEDAVTLIQAALAAEKGCRSAYRRAKAVGQKYDLLVFRPEDFPSVAVDSRCWLGGSFLVA